MRAQQYVIPQLLTNLQLGYATLEGQLDKHGKFQMSGKLPLECGAKRVDFLSPATLVNSPASVCDCSVFARYGD